MTVLIRLGSELNFYGCYIHGGSELNFYGCYIHGKSMYNFLFGDFGVLLYGR